jgi:sulfite reductase (NADPH) flavoprotein alpha-component
MDDCKATDLAGMSRLLLLASTFGDGDPPDNGSAFWSSLEAGDAPRLEHLQFSVLAFGDSNYDRFCGFGRKLDARLEALGARRLASRADCEPEFQDRAEAWLAAVAQALAGTSAPAPQAVAREIPVAADGGDDDEEAAPLPDAKPAYDRNRPLRSRLILNRLLNAAGAEKETRQFAFDLADSGFTYEAGDALGVWPNNCPDLAAEMLAALRLSPAAPVVANGDELPLSEALLRHYEIARITQDLLRFVAERSGSGALAELLKEENKAQLKEWLWGRQIVDVLYEFPIQVTAGEWLGALKRLQPRLYSIASSPKVDPAQVHLTVSTVRYRAGDKARGGVCSTFLADRAAGTEVPIFLQKSAHFRPPADPDTPMVMVGPGTGVAPFRAFLQERRALGAKGKNWLFFGEQRAAADFYYRDEFETLQKDAYLHRLDTAFSRDQAEKIYVQHRMLEHGAELWAWLEEGAYFYVCGDAGRMAKDVDAALRRIVQNEGGMSAERAAAYIDRMMRDKRYLRDVY